MRDVVDCNRDVRLPVRTKMSSEFIIAQLLLREKGTCNSTNGSDRRCELCDNIPSTSDMGQHDVK